MSWECRGLDVTAEANEDLSNDQYRFVVIDGTTGKVRRPDAANERALGVLQNAPNAAGEPAVVRVDGFSKVQAAGALTAGALVTPEYNSASDAGKALATTTKRDFARGQVVESASAEDELATIKLIDLHLPDTGADA